jgi:hypothetical protein
MLVQPENSVANFSIVEGALNFADTRAWGNLAEFFNLSLVLRPFQKIPAALDANYFITDTARPVPPFKRLIPR